MGRARRGGPDLAPPPSAQASSPAPAYRHPDPGREGGFLGADPPEAGDHGRAEDRAGPRSMKAVGPAAPAAVGLPFLWRRLRATLVPRPGAATAVPFDREALLRNPGVTWIGHATLLVRMDGAGFLTDPVFSERASPLSFAGPRRLVPPGVPLRELPPLHFALLPHHHSYP